MQAMSDKQANKPRAALRSLPLLCGLVSLGALALGCASGEAPQAPAPAAASESVGKSAQALAGVDGNRTIGAAGTVVNQYTTLAANVALGATTLSVPAIAALANGADPLAPGDLVLVIQMQGATLNTANNDNTWGQVSAIGGAGHYEFAEVSAINGNVLTFSCALKNAYATGQGVQVVRVPQYDVLTISAGASITAPAWNGTTGGVVAVHAKTTLNLAGSIDVSGLGFRGGQTDDVTGAAGTDIAIYASASNADGALKGEGVGGLLLQYGRAPAGNGGGGGNSHNGGGGGGANARLGATWTGQGVFPAAGAWTLDPGYSVTASEGGGRGGYTYSASNQDATAVAPGAAAWGGNQRRERGGLGGHPLDNDPSTRVFLGGGGGAGDGNNGHAGRGGNGGGLVLILAGAVTGTGSILANGEAGVVADSISAGQANGDAPGGGGAGGTVIVRATTTSAISVQALGGTGGNQLLNNGAEAEGPGGGGGGGYVSISGTSGAVVTGGAGGTTTSPALTEFPANGATSGSGGQAIYSAVGALPYCVDSTAPSTTIATKPPNPSSDPTGDFTFTSNDGAATFECRVDGAAFGVCTATFATAPLADGSHTIEVRAKDAVGNVDPVPPTYTWVVDTVAPDTTIVNRPSDPTSDATGDFTFTSEVGATFECSLDGATYAVCTTPYTTTALTEGSHTFSVRAKDLAGNVDQSPATYTWVVDLTPPSTVIATHPTDPTSDVTGDFTFTSEPGATFECKIDSAASFTPCNATFATQPLADGSHTITVRAVDTVGNVDPLPPTYTWVVKIDTDGDGLGDGDERAIGTDPNDADSDDDGVPDGAESGPGIDSDGDGLINALDPDSDNDGIFDGTETGVSVAPPGTDVTRGHFVPDADPSTKTNPLDPDTDHGGIHDGAEDTNHNGKIDTGERDPNNAADDSTAIVDSDGDGLTDDEEKGLHTNPLDADTDDDGVLDGAEANPADDTDGDGLINALDPDSDNDGLFDGTEVGLDCANPATDNSRHLCIADADAGQTKTSPVIADTDGGGVRDGSEDANRNGVVDSGETDPTTGHKADDASVVDSDGDGLSDGLEGSLGSNPHDADTDDDGVPDGLEPNPSADADQDGLIDVLDVDSDNDGLLDGTELGFGCGGAGTDAANKHCVADADPGTKTSAVNPDTDFGGAKDGSEDSNLDGKLDSGEQNPVSGHASDDASVIDTDGDGLSDNTEGKLGSDPTDVDSDDDGLLDGAEPNPSDDRDGDQKIDILDSDSDGDGLFDGTEAGQNCSNPDTDPSQNQCRADADPQTTTRVLIVDTDFGGVGDGMEDTNLNGRRDPGERDPLNALDDSLVSPEGGAGGVSGEAGAPAQAGAGGEPAGGANAGGAGGVPSGGTAGTTAGAESGGAQSGGAQNGGAQNGGALSGGQGNGGGATQPSDEKIVILGGGLCAYRPATPENSGWLLLGALGVGTALRRRRARKSAEG